MNITFVTTGEVPSALLKILSFDDYKTAICTPSQILKNYPVDPSTMMVIISNDCDEIAFIIQELRAARSKSLILANVTKQRFRRGAMIRAQLLNCGADDAQCLITVEEMYARIQALFRRTQIEGEALEHGIIRIPAEHNGRVFIDQTPIRLTGKEFFLFHKLVAAPARIFSKEALMEGLYSHHEDRPTSKIVDVFVCKARKKIKAAAGGVSLIQTVWGLGYQIAPACEHGHE